MRIGFCGLVPPGIEIALEVVEELAVPDSVKKVQRTDEWVAAP